MKTQNPTLPKVVSPNLEEDSEHERRRMPRLTLTTEQFKMQRNGKVYPVADLSLGGMAIRVLDPADFVLFTVGSDVEGLINLHRNKYPVIAKVKNIRHEVVGCEFLGLGTQTIEALHQAFNPETLGKEIKPMPASEGASLWFHGPSGTDILLWRGTDGQYKRLSVFLLGSYIQWDEESGLTTGRALPTEEQAEVRGALRFETLDLVKDPQVDLGRVELARALLESTSIGQDLKTWCSRKLSLK